MIASEPRQPTTRAGTRDSPLSSERITAVVHAAAAAVKGDRTQLMDVVQAIQYHLGHLPKGAVPLVADALGVHAVEVEDTVSFYAYLEREPKGRFSHSAVEDTGVINEGRRRSGAGL